MSREKVEQLCQRLTKAELVAFIVSETHGDERWLQLGLARVRYEAARLEWLATCEKRDQAHKQAVEATDSRSAIRLREAYIHLESACIEAKERRDTAWKAYLTAQRQLEQSNAVAP